MNLLTTAVRLDAAASADLAAWAQTIEQDSTTPFAAAQQIVRRLGAHCRADGRAEIGFWCPGLFAAGIAEHDIFLEVLTPLEAVDLQADRQQLQFQRALLNMQRAGDYLWAVVEGMQAGSRDTVGSFYWLKYRTADGGWRTLPDVLAHSMPFGAFAPSEYYDIARMQQERADRAYFQALAREGEVVRLGPPTNILQMHINTASAAATLAGLTRTFQALAEKVQDGLPLTAVEECYYGYDAIQLLPIEPIIAREAGPANWEGVEDHDPFSADVIFDMRRPTATNWGYDVVIAGSSAINPGVLESRRPDELVDFIATLHNFPGKPIKVIFDVVFGHADNQALEVLDSTFFTGPNMYGQDLNHRHPTVRAILLEMQRRKADFGADGLRVDGAQDFRYWNPQTEELLHDDEYLQSMSDVVQEVADCRYRPWMIFEDGRPWPRDDWELASTYRAVIEEQPDTFQWGPLTFAHNTPFLFTFWVSKWWRLEEIVQRGSNWINGCANHDTLRRGTQVDPDRARINTRLGATRLEILDKAYDNPAANLLTYSCLPGVPMDFINASMRASWGFIRNTDERYGVKVLSEETGFLTWQVDAAHFDRPGNFVRLKAFGFDDLEEFRRFMRMLSTAVVITDDDIAAIVKLLQAAEPPLAGPELSPEVLKAIVQAWMDDAHEYCNVAYYRHELDPEFTRFNLAVREFRRSRPWLRANLGAGEHFARRQPCDGTVLFYGLRQAPDGGEQVLFVANMEGAPLSVRPPELPIPGLAREGWRIALKAPGLVCEAAEDEICMEDSQGLVLVRDAR
ncbi:hypothetical protein HUS23_12380 [Ectothiorhodospiraceae bacterium 2226]|nr:hypothetical protein HUS23_12380 [Ectothiorhodospiraceae bacterium 2226]